MFQNLTLKGFTFHREPVLYVALLIAVANVVQNLLQGGVSAGDAAEAILSLLAGFFIRGKVSPA